MVIPYGCDLTPTKSVSWVNLSPESKGSICILCAENVLNSNFRRRLFTALTTSPACVNTKLYFPSEASLFSVPVVSEPKTTALTSFSRRIDTWSFIRETKGKITTQTVSIGSHSPCLKKSNTKRAMWHVRLPWACQCNPRYILATNVSLYNFPLILSNFLQFKLKRLSPCARSFSSASFTSRAIDMLHRIRLLEIWHQIIDHYLIGYSLWHTADQKTGRLKVARSKREKSVSRRTT